MNKKYAIVGLGGWFFYSLTQLVTPDLDSGTSSVIMYFSLGWFIIWLIVAFVVGKDDD